MMLIIDELYQVIEDRKSDDVENSYTSYLFKSGLNKILKKVAEESGEVIIAAKDGKNTETIEEICDLVYHLLVMMSELEIKPEDVEEVLKSRRMKIGNKK